ncbi:MAG TPA: hypothetical protein VFS21_36655 [Roseiflexaceae bacterium]|nr:hypothetical protein [Roseiflexaceae bacterium]
MAIFASTYDPARRLLTTELTGTVSVADVRAWRASLERALAQISDNTAFGLISDLSGYGFAEIAAHKELREVIPLALAACGLRTALLDLFEGADLPIGAARGVRCIAAAHVHHDHYKMQGYDQQIGRAHERFFSERAEAEAWIASLLGPS